MIILKISSSLLSVSYQFIRTSQNVRYTCMMQELRGIVWTFMLIFLFVHESEYSWFDFLFPAIPPVIMNALEKKAFMKVDQFYILKYFFFIFRPISFTTSCHLVFVAIPSFKCSSSSGACGSVVSKGKMIMSLLFSPAVWSIPLRLFSPLAWCLQPLFAALSSRKRGTAKVTPVCNVINSCIQFLE